MKRSVRRLASNNKGVVAPVVALSLFALIAVGGIAFDYAHMAALDTELQQAADQAALAAATQLDGKANAIARATAAAQNLVVNNTRFANDIASRAITISTPTFYDSYNQSTDSFGTITTADASAKVVKVAVGGRKAYFALTPIVAWLNSGANNSGAMNAEAVASIGSAICKTPPVMVCNPDEPSNNTDDLLPFSGAPGIGLRLVTGSPGVPGNFGYLESNQGNGASALAASLGYNTPPGDCLPETGVTTKTGLDTSVLNAFNTRFDIYANGNQTCPSQLGGTCSPALNTRKDLVCGSNPNNCTGANSWSEASKPYRLPTQSGVQVEAPLPANKSQDPTIMGFPQDICQAGPSGTLSCPSTDGNGTWDRDAYFRVNYGYADAAAWQGATNLSASATRFQVYQWEQAHPSVTVGGKTAGMNVPQKDTGNNRAFSYPATGVAGVGPGPGQADRRRISVAVLNCQSLNVHGKTFNAPVASWLDVFLIEPSVSRPNYSDPKGVYVEYIGKTTNANGNTSQVVRRDKPFLIR